MQKTPDDLFNELSSNPDFAVYFSTDKDEFLSQLQDPSFKAEEVLQQVFGIENATDVLKKKETTNQLAGEDVSISPSPSVGPTENVVAPAPVVKGADNPPVKSFPGLKTGTLKSDGSQNSYFNIVRDQYQNAYRDIQLELKKPTVNFGLLKAKVKTFGDLYQQFAPNEAITDDFNIIIKQLQEKYYVEGKSGILALYDKKPGAKLSADFVMGTPKQVQTMLEKESQYEFVDGKRFRRIGGVLEPVYDSVSEKEKAVEDYLWDYKTTGVDEASSKNLIGAFDIRGHIAKVGDNIPDTQLTKITDVTYQGGPFTVANSGELMINPIWVESEAERYLDNSGIISENLVKRMNDIARGSGMAISYTKEDIKEILLPQIKRTMTQEFDQKWLVDRATREMTRQGTFDNLEKEQSVELKTFVENTARYYQGVRSQYSTNLSLLEAEFKPQFDQITAEWKRVHDDPNIAPDEKAQFLAETTERQSALYTQMMDKKAVFDQQYKEETEKTRLRVQQEAETLKKKTETRYNEAYKQAAELVSQQAGDTRSFVGQVGNTMLSRTYGMMRAVVDATNAAWGVENNPFSAMESYLLYAENQKNVNVGSFSDAIDRSGLFSTDALKTAILNTAQQIPNMAAAITTTVLTQNPYFGGMVGWVQDSIDQAGQNYRDVFEKTGSVEAAEKAAQDSWKYQLALAPTYALEMVPFVQGALGKIGRGLGVVGFGKKVATNIALESITETIQESVQQYNSYRLSAQNPQSYYQWLEANGKKTLIDILPSTVFFGMAGSVSEQRGEAKQESTKAAVREMLGKTGMVDMMNEIAGVLGSNGLQFVPEEMYRRNLIDRDQLMQMKQVVADVVETKKNTEGIITDPDQQRYYVITALRKKGIQTELGKEDITTERKQLLENALGEVDSELKAIASGSDRRYTKLNYTNGGYTLVPNDIVEASLVGAELGMESSLVNQVADTEGMEFDIQDSKLKARFDEYAKKRAERKQAREAEQKKKRDEALAQEQQIASVGPQTVGGLSAEQSQANLGTTVDQVEQVQQLKDKYANDPNSTVEQRVQEAQNLQTVLDEVAPGMKIVLMEAENFGQAMSNLGQSADRKGNFNIRKNADGTYSGEIHINVNSADATTVAHEVAHAVMLSKMGANMEAFNEMAQAISSVVPADIQTELQKFVQGYMDFNQAEEYLVQLSATMAATDTRLSVGVMQQIAKAISDFVAKITGGKVQLFESIKKRSDFVDFMNNLSETLSNTRVSEPDIQPQTQQENAVQEQTAGQVPVQPETLPGQEVVQGEPQTEPQGVTQEGQGQAQVNRAKNNPLQDVDSTTAALEGIPEIKNIAKRINDSIFDYGKDQDSLYGRKGSTTDRAAPKDGTRGGKPQNLAKKNQRGTNPPNRMVGGPTITKDAYEQRYQNYGSNELGDNKQILSRKPVRVFHGNVVDIDSFGDYVNSFGQSDQPTPNTQEFGLYAVVAPFATLRYAETYAGRMNSEPFVYELVLPKGKYIPRYEKVSPDVLKKIGTVNGVDFTNWKFVDIGSDLFNAIAATFFDWNSPKNEFVNDGYRLYQESKVKTAALLREKGFVGLTSYIAADKSSGQYPDAYELFDPKDAKISQKSKVVSDERFVAEAYHAAKADGSDPNLVKEVESILTPPNDGVNRAQNISPFLQDINQNGLKASSLEPLGNLAADVESGKTRIPRFSEAEHAGFKLGGRTLTESVILLSQDEGIDNDYDRTRSQTRTIEQYSRLRGDWQQDAPQFLHASMGNLDIKLNAPQPADVISFVDKKNKKVYQTTSLDRYPDLRTYLDGIVRFNAKYPTQAIKVLSYGRDDNGVFQVVSERPMGSTREVWNSNLQPQVPMTLESSVNRAQIVGENAQLSANIRGNLQVAREMEQAGESVKTIRVATGWERGVDGLWRYEIPDPQLSVDSYEELQKLLDTKGNVLPTLVSLSAKDLFQNLDFGGKYRNNTDRLTLFFDKSLPLGMGVFVGSGIHINPLSAKYTWDYEREGAFDDFKSVLYHELQHYIQREEGFAKGFSPDSFKFDLKDEISFAKDELKDAQRKSKYNPEFADKVKVLEERLKALQEKMSLSKEELDRMYWISSGEVEARNVQGRMKMTPEQRLETPLFETEDVARESQLVFDADIKGVNRAQAPISDEQIADVFSKSPSLSKIGSTQQYREYLQQVFPSSLHKNIVYRAGNVNAEEFANSFEQPTDYLDLGQGLYFSPSKKISSNYGVPRAAILNITRPKDRAVAEQQRVDYAEANNGVTIPKLDDDGQYDAIVDTTVDFEKNYEVVVFDDSQVHILGDEKDIRQFDDWVKNAVQNTAGLNRAQNTVQNIAAVWSIPNATPEEKFRTLIEQGYNFRQLQQALGVTALPSADYPPFKTAYGDALAAAFAKVKDTFGQRIIDCVYYIGTEFETFGRPFADVYQDLIDLGYFPHEIFVALTKDGRYMNEAKEFFGNDYRQTIENILQGKDMQPALQAIKDELREDSRNLHVAMQTGEIMSLFQTSGLGLVESGMVAQAFVDYLEAEGTQSNMILFAAKLKEALNDPDFDPGQIENMTETFAQMMSMSGRMLQLARGFVQKNMQALIDKQLAKDGIVLTPKQRQTLITLINEVKAGQKTREMALRTFRGTYDANGNLLAGGPLAWSDQALEDFAKSEKALQNAHVHLQRFLNNHKVKLWNERITAGMKKGLISITTPILSIYSNFETGVLNRLAPGRFVSLRRDKAEGMRTFHFSPTATYKSHQLAKHEIWSTMWNSFRYGSFDTQSQVEKYFDNLGGVDFFKDPQWLFTSLGVLARSKGKDIRNMTDVELADLFNLTLTETENGVELRDGVSYNFLRSFWWTTNLGAVTAVLNKNPAYLLSSLGPVITEITGRMMSYSGDVVFAKMATTRAMIDYLQAIDNARYSDGVFANLLRDKTGGMSDTNLRAFYTLLSAHSQLREPFDRVGLKRTLMDDNAITKVLGAANSWSRKRARELYLENRSQTTLFQEKTGVKGGSLPAEIARQFTGTGIKKNVYQILDTFVGTLVPFIKVPTNFVGQALVKLNPVLATLWYAGSEFNYQRQKAKFNKAYPIDKVLKTDAQKLKYEKAKIKLFLEKRQVVFNTAQMVNSFAIHGLLKLAVVSGAVTARGEEEEEKVKEATKIPSSSFNVTRFKNFISELTWGELSGYMVPGYRTGKEVKFAAKNQGWSDGDFIIGTNNFGFWGMGVGTVQTSVRSRRRKAVEEELGLISPSDVQKFTGAVEEWTMGTAALNSSLNNLPTLQGPDRFFSALKDMGKGRDRVGQRFAANTISTMFSVNYPAAMSFMAKGRAELVQSTKEIYSKFENKEHSDIFFGQLNSAMFGDMMIEIIQRLNPKFSIPEQTQNDFYKARIGPFGDDLSKKVTLAEPGSFLAYVQAAFLPFEIHKHTAKEKITPERLAALQDDYNFSVNTMAGLVGLAATYENINDRPYSYTKGGKKGASFDAVLTNPQPNKFKYENQENPDTPPVEYSLPNDLYREYLQYRGKYIARVLRDEKFLTTMVENTQESIKVLFERAETEDEIDAAGEEASRLIEIAFNKYDELVSKGLKAFEDAYITDMGVSFRPEEIAGVVKPAPNISRDGHLRQMAERGILGEDELKKLSGHGFVPPETKKPR